ncbi:glutaredoxin [Pseudoxanthomonas wuyuanensis]|uniref:Glutaredoxin n=1 Tax=Pseudoxanthomonas wuyuanensis TaxID=1073196 RepID=A0A286CYY1_9GAMM|nr:glutaredoxin [Pseudoxanthomonas wuyuanensis]SOD51613.1 hypothetical protein SAMN06296416_101739 [Pseudoxanthomonas wuyuanensis]
MNVLKVCAALGVVVAATALWKSYVSTGELNEMGSRLIEKVKGSDSTGFASIPTPDGVSSRGIVIFAPRNCPSDAARRTEVLVQHLSSKGIRYSRTDSANYDNLASAEEASRVMSVMNGPIPVVYVNGKAKANPTPEEVEAEHSRSSKG